MELEFLTLDEVAAKFHVSRRWLREFLHGKAIGRKIGRDMIFSAADVMEIYRRLPECRSSPETRPGSSTIFLQVELNREPASPSFS